MLRDHGRIAVVGTSGCGKTTFARELARLTGREHIELDALYWGPNWTQRSDFAERVRAAVERDAWIVDGNYGDVREGVWLRATAIVWLDYSFRTIFRRALTRTARRVVSREALYSGNRESVWRALFDPEGIPWWVVRTYRRRKREYAALLRDARYAHLEAFRLGTPDEAEALLRSSV